MNASESNGVPELVLGPFAKDFFDLVEGDEKIGLIVVLFSLLLDPIVDNAFKFDADYYPYTGRGVREFFDQSWYLTYVVAPNESVHILLILRRDDLLLPPNPQR